MREKHRSMIHLPLIGGTPTRTINGVTVQAAVRVYRDCLPRLTRLKEA